MKYRSESAWRAEYIATADYSDDKRLALLYRRAVSAGFAKRSEAARLLFWTLAEHCHERELAGAYFRACVERGHWNGTIDQENRARLRLRRLDDESGGMPGHHRASHSRPRERPAP